MGTCVVLSLGSNLGNRALNIRRALHLLGPLVRVVRTSSLWETTPVDAPPASPSFLNMVVAGLTDLEAPDLLRRTQEIESSMGRVRTSRNAPRPMDIDLIFYGATLSRSKALTLPHPRYARREFVLAPLRELRLPWVDPSDGRRIEDLRGEGMVRRI